MEHHNCLNCDTQLVGKFCSSCGQKSDTHRITLKHFLFHDILHGVWHMEKGILFTVKEALLRPGKAALDYISGKRIRYYNVFYLILLLIGLNIFLNHYFDKMHNEYFEKELIINNKFENFATTNAKSIIFSFVPFFALNSFILFKRKKLNLSEHFIIAGITFLGILIFSAFSTLTGFLEFFNYLEYLSIIDGYLTPMLISCYLIYSYYTAFGENYSKLKFSFKMVLFLLFLFFEFILVFVLIFGYLTHWEFGRFSYQV